MAVRIVVARSEALIPVVVPRRASIDSQNGVPNAEVFRCVIGTKFSASQRSSVKARQIRPRPSRAMKLTASGVIFSAAIVRSPSFSRSSSSTSTIIRPWRISSRASSTLANGEFGSGIRSPAQDPLPLVYQMHEDVKKDRAHDAGAGNRQHPGPDDAARDSPAYGSQAIRSANARDGARDNVS